MEGQLVFEACSFLSQVAEQVDHGAHKDTLLVLAAEFFLMLEQEIQHGLIRRLTQLRNALGGAPDDA